jgi:hypothetical protein
MCSGKLQAKDFYITQMPPMMPWGWRHVPQFPKLCALSLSG